MRMKISYDEYRRSVYIHVFAFNLRAFPDRDILRFLVQQDDYIRENYIHATDLKLFKTIHRNHTEEDVQHFINGDFMESDISGTAFGLGWMF